jgi:transaldolase
MYREDLKFSLWADFIEREYLDKEFKELIEKKVINGATSNPAIFKNAILTSPAYKQQLSSLDGMSPKEKYEALAIHDIQKAADILKPLYDAGDDGYVSIEVDPFLCDDAAATIAEGKRLYKTIGRENVMIKVPATEAGYSAMQELSASAIPVNATLIFTKAQAIACAKAFAEGAKKSSKVVDTVISIFVSRIDRALDATLQKHGVAPALSGIYNSAAIYSAIEAMQVPGCRALFASTGVKDDTLSAYYYVDALLAYNSVNTAPIDTIKAFDANGAKQKALPIAPEVIQEHFAKVMACGINFETVLQKQIDDGLVAFKEAFQDILEAL